MKISCIDIQFSLLVEKKCNNATQRRQLPPCAVGRGKHICNLM